MLPVPSNAFLALSLASCAGQTRSRACQCPCNTVVEVHNWAYDCVFFQWGIALQPKQNCQIQNAYRTTSALLIHCGHFLFELNEFVLTEPALSFQVLLELVEPFLNVVELLVILPFQHSVQPHASVCALDVSHACLHCCNRCMETQLSCSQESSKGNQLTAI